VVAHAHQAPQMITQSPQDTLSSQLGHVERPLESIKILRNWEVINVYIFKHTQTCHIHLQRTIT
jgi:hypothetical protein